MSRPFKIRVTYEGKEWSLVVLKRPEENRWFLGLRQAYNVAVDMGARSLSWGAFYKRLASNSKAVMCQASSFERGILIRAGALDLRAPSASATCTGLLLRKGVSGSRGRWCDLWLHGFWGKHG